MTDLFKKNASAKNQELAAKLEENLTLLEDVVVKKSKEYLQILDEDNVSEAEKIIWNHQVLMFLYQANLSVMQTILNFQENKLGGTE